MFSYGTGGLHTLPLHLVRFLWLPALNVCSLIGDWFLLLVPHPILSLRLPLQVLHVVHNPRLVGRGVDTKILNAEHKS